MRIDVPDGDEVRGELVAIDLETRSIRWTAPDIATECKPTVIDGMGVVAQAQTGTPRLGEDAAALVVLSIRDGRSEEHTSELPSLMRSSYAVFCLKQIKNLQERKN